MKKRFWIILFMAALILPKAAFGKDADLGGFDVEVGVGTLTPAPEKPRPTKEPDPPKLTEKPEPPQPTQKPNTPRPTQKPNTPQPTQKPNTPWPTQKPHTPQPTQKPDSPKPTQKPTESPETPQPAQKPKASDAQEPAKKTGLPSPAVTAAEDGASKSLHASPFGEAPEEKAEGSPSLFVYPKGPKKAGYSPKIRIRGRELMDVLSFRVDGKEVFWRWEESFLAAPQVFLSKGEHRVELLLLGEGGALHWMPPWTLQIR